MVLPLVPVTPTSASVAAGSPSTAAEKRGQGRARVRHLQPGSAGRGGSSETTADGALPARGLHELVAVGRQAADGHEERPGPAPGASRGSTVARPRRAASPVGDGAGQARGDGLQLHGDRSCARRPATGDPAVRHGPRGQLEHGTTSRPRSPRPAPGAASITRPDPLQLHDQARGGPRRCAASRADRPRRSGMSPGSASASAGGGRRAARRLVGRGDDRRGGRALDGAQARGRGRRAGTARCRSACSATRANSGAATSPPWLCGAPRRVERHEDDERRPRRGHEAHEGGHVVDHRVAAGGVDLLRGAGLARHRVAGDGGPLAGASLDHALQDLGEHVDGLRLQHAAHRHRVRRLAPPGPSRSSMRRTIVRLHQVAAVGHRGHRHRHLQRGDADLLPEGQRGQREGAPARGGPQQAADSPGSSTPVGAPKPKSRT